MGDPWYPGADRSRPASSDGGSILGGKPKLLWHDTESSGLPSYSSGSFPHFTVDPGTGHVWQHIPVNRAARALKNLDGGCQTNRWRVIQVEIIGFVNKVPYHSALGKLAAWAKTEHGVPATCGVGLLAYDASYGDTSVRLSCAEWDGYSGHCYHMSAPENDHGDPGKPFPIDQILAAAAGEEDMQVESFTADAKADLREQARLGSQDTLRSAVGTDKDDPASDYFDTLGGRVAELHANMTEPVPVVVDADAVAAALAANEEFLAAIAKTVNDDAAARAAE